jgi:hypothetical protein
MPEVFDDIPLQIERNDVHGIDSVGKVVKRPAHHILAPHRSGG